MSYCPYCGAKNDDTSMFCVICGKELPKTEGPGFDPNDTTGNDPNAGARGSQPKYSEHRDEGIMMILSIIFPDWEYCGWKIFGGNDPDDPEHRLFALGFFSVTVPGMSGRVDRRSDPDASVRQRIQRYPRQDRQSALVTVSGRPCRIFSRDRLDGWALRYHSEIHTVFRLHLS